MNTSVIFDQTELVFELTTWLYIKFLIDNAVVYYQLVVVCNWFIIIFHCYYWQWMRRDVGIWICERINYFTHHLIRQHISISYQVPYLQKAFIFCLRYVYNMLILIMLLFWSWMYCWVEEFYLQLPSWLIMMSTNIIVSSLTTIRVEWE